jgi:hypothetical protein
MSRFQHILDILHSYKVLVESAANAAEIKARQTENAQLRVSLTATEHAQIANRLLSVLNWLSPANAILDQEAASMVRQENPLTGQWILQESKVNAWIKWDNATVNSLWLTGIPGAGKHGFPILYQTLLTKTQEKRSWHRLSLKSFSDWNRISNMFCSFIAGIRTPRDRTLSTLLAHCWPKFYAKTMIFCPTSMMSVFAVASCN